MKLKIIDWYIIRKYLGTFVYALVLIIIITIIFDISEKVDDFLEREAPLKAIVFDYYFNFIPYFVNLFTSLFTFLAVIFFTSKMASQTEIIAILNSGMSYPRLLRPYMIASAIIAIFSFLLMGYIIPPANKVRLDFEEKYIKNAYHFRATNIHRQIEPGIYIFMESYNNFYNIGYKFSIEKFENGELKSKLISDYIKWDSVKNKWTIHSYYIRDYNGMSEKITSGSSIDTTIRLHPSEFNQRINIVEAMNNNELSRFIDNQLSSGNENVTLFLIEKYKRFAYPFSTFILAIIGLTLASKKTRGGIGLNIGLGLLFAFSYIMLMQVSTVFSINAGMNPLIAVWVPNLIYAVIAAVLYRQAAR